MDTIEKLASKFGLTRDEATQLFREGEMWKMEMKPHLNKEKITISISHIFRHGTDFISRQKDMTGSTKNE